MIHHTRGVYNNGEFKDNGVASEHLAQHIQYNLTMRPGRAFFVDGVCLNKGYLDDDRIKAMEALLASGNFPKYRDFSNDTAPYV